VGTLLLVVSAGASKAERTRNNKTSVQNKRGLPSIAFLSPYDGFPLCQRAGRHPHMNLDNEARFSKKCVCPHGGIMVTREEEQVQA
jgi:hypothetical protein